MLRVSWVKLLEPMEKAVKVLGELDDIGRDFAHDVNLKAVFPPRLNPVLGHDVQHLLHLADRLAEWDHHDGAGEAHLFAQPLNLAALERE